MGRSSVPDSRGKMFASHGHRSFCEVAAAATDSPAAGLELFPIPPGPRSFVEPGRTRKKTGTGTGDDGNRTFSGGQFRSERDASERTISYRRNKGGCVAL